MWVGSGATRQEHLHTSIGQGGKKTGDKGPKKGLIERLGGLEVEDGLLYGVVGCGLKLPQEGHKLVAHLIATVVEGDVGDILDMLEVMLLGVCLDVVATKGEQGAHHKSIHRQDAVEARKTGATKQVEEESFGSIVAVVGGKDGGIALLLAELVEIVVAKLTGRVFHAEVLAGSMVEGLELRHMDGDPIGGSQLTYKLLVAVAVARPKMEVAVGDGEGKSSAVHKMGQHHRIDAATNSKQHLLPRGEEVLLLNVSYKGV